MKKRVVIVGAGLAGSSLSEFLTDTGEFTVIIIEKGDENSYRAIQNKEDDLATVPTYCIGNAGTTNLWHNGLILPNNRTLEKFGLAEYIDKAASFLGFKLNHSFKSYMSDEKNFQENVASDSIFYPKERKKIRSKFNESFFNSEVGKINTKGGVVESIDIISEGNLTNIKADYFVISCGGLGTPRLLKKLGVFKGELNFIDHPMGFVGNLKIKKEFSDSFLRFSGRLISGGEIKNALTCNLGGLSSALYFRPGFLLSYNKSIVKYKSLLGASSSFLLLKRVLDIRIFHPDIIAEIFYKLFSFRLRKSVYSLLLVCEQKDSNNVLTMDSAKLVLSKEELDTYNLHLNYYRDVLEKYCINLNLLETLTRSNFWSAAHYSGGNCLSNYVDENTLSFKGLENLYVCDASVIQEHSYTNTGLEIVARALKLVGELK